MYTDIGYEYQGDNALLNIDKGLVTQNPAEVLCAGAGLQACMSMVAAWLVLIRSISNFTVEEYNNMRSLISDSNDGVKDRNSTEFEVPESIHTKLLDTYPNMTNLDMTYQIHDIQVYSTLGQSAFDAKTSFQPPSNYLIASPTVTWNVGQKKYEIEFMTPYDTMITVQGGNATTEEGKLTAMMNKERKGDEAIADDQDYRDEKYPELIAGQLEAGNFSMLTGRLTRKMSDNYLTWRMASTPEVYWKDQQVEDK